MLAVTAQVILMDMIPFMMVLSIAMLGCTIFFAIHQSRPDNIHGLFSMLVTVFHMTLGIGQGIDTSNASLMTVVVVTAFTSFVVVVLYVFASYGRCATTR